MVPVEDSEKGTREGQAHERGLEAWGRIQVTPLWVLEAQLHQLNICAQNGNMLTVVCVISLTEKRCSVRVCISVSVTICPQLTQNST